jgi:uncharacterized hydantoinase/oxoprolinase family protein
MMEVASVNRVSTIFFRTAVKQREALVNKDERTTDIIPITKSNPNLANTN